MGKVPKFLQTGSGEESRRDNSCFKHPRTPQLRSSLTPMFSVSISSLEKIPKSSIWNSTRLHRVCTGQHFDLSYLKKAACVTMEMVANNSGFPPTSQHTNTLSGDGSPVSFLSFPVLLKRTTVSSWSSPPG